MRTITTLLIFGMIWGAGCSKEARVRHNQPKVSKSDKATPEPATAEPKTDQDTPKVSATPTPEDILVPKPGLYAIRESNADKSKLVPAEGDLVLIAQSSDGMWHLISLRDGVPMSHVESVSEEVLLGGTTYTLHFDATGKAKLAALTAANVGKPLAWVMDGHARFTAVVKTEIDSGLAQITCSGPDKFCYGFFHPAWWKAK